MKNQNIYKGIIRHKSPNKDLPGFESSIVGSSSNQLLKSPSGYRFLNLNTTSSSSLKFERNEIEKIEERGKEFLRRQAEA